MASESESFYIGAKAAQTNYYAFEQAARIGYPLNYAVTINFASTVIDPRKAVPAFAKLRRNRFGKWITRHLTPAPPTYTYVFENVRDDEPFLTMGPGDPHNVHVHWNLHLPAESVFGFKQQVWAWVETVTGGITGGEETIMIKSLPAVATGYLLKGARPQHGRIYARGQESKPQGIIIGLRADASRNIGPSARRAGDRAAGIRRQLPVIRKHSENRAGL